MTTDIVTSSHITYATEWLGKKVLSTNPNQVLLESDDTFIDKFAIHPLNRNVDMIWVSQMKVEVLKTVMAQECMTLTLAIDKRLIVQAMTDPDTNEDQGGFKAIILDGQHRWEAMKQLKEEIPTISFKIWIILYIVANDAEIVQRLDTLNKRRSFSKDDDDKVAVTKRFLDALSSIHTQEYQTRRSIGKVRKSAILKSDQFIKKHRHTTTKQFQESITSIASTYKESWEASQPYCKSSSLCSTIQATKLYQLVDGTCEWLNKV